MGCVATAWTPNSRLAKLQRSCCVLWRLTSLRMTNVRGATQQPVPTEVGTFHLSEVLPALRLKSMARSAFINGDELLLPSDAADARNAHSGNSSRNLPSRTTGRRASRE